MARVQWFWKLLAPCCAILGLVNQAHADEPIGMLECTIEAGVAFGISSDKKLNCTFRPERGRPEYYTGTMHRTGIDIGITGEGVFLWSVVALGNLASRFPLAGTYSGAMTELAVGAGLGANALVGANGAISLQPVSFNAAFGVSLAAGVGEITLQPAPPAPLH